MVWVKLCAMTNAEDAVAAAECGADAIGMIFAPSKRRITVDQAKEIVRAVPNSIEKVGVFANEAAATIQEIVIRVGLTAVQLHGDESPEFARALLTNMHGIRVFKTVHVVDGAADIASDFFREPIVHAILLDAVLLDPNTGRTERGGTGETFDWSLMRPALAPVKGTSRVIVAGGLTPGNVAEAISVLAPWGVDVCSGVEREVGKKDATKMRQFVNAAKAARN